MKTKLFQFLLGYGAIMLVFSSVYYYLLWKSDVRHFIINNSYKSTMLNDDEAYKYTLDNDYIFNIPKNIKTSNYFKQQYESSLLQMQEADHRRDLVHMKLTEVEPKIDDIIKRYNAILEKESFTKKLEILEKFNNEAAKATSKMLDNTKKLSSGGNRSKYNDLQLLIDQNELRYIQKEIESKKFTELNQLEIKNETKDLQNKMTKEDSNLYSQYEKLRNDEMNIKITINNRANALKELKNGYEAALREEVGLVDFIYFSFITGTTVGFGDIVPASTDARVVVIFEIIFCVLYLGFGLNVISSNGNFSDIFSFHPKELIKQLLQKLKKQEK